MDNDIVTKPELTEIEEAKPAEPAEPTTKTEVEPKPTVVENVHQETPSKVNDDDTIQAPVIPVLGEQPAASPAPDKAVRPPLPVNPELRRAAEDVRILYSYVSREGRLEPDKLLEEPLTVYAELPDRVLDEAALPSYEERAMLWRVLSELSKIAYPATPDSIRNSYYSQMMETPGIVGRLTNKSALRPIWIIGVVGFLSTLLLGLYVSFTESVMADTTLRIEEFNNVRTAIYSGTRLEKLAMAQKIPTIPTGNTKAGAVVATGATPPADPPNDDPPGPAITAAMDNDTQSITAFKELRNQALDEIDTELRKSFQILSFTTFGLAQYDGTKEVDSRGEYSLFGLMPLNVQGYINKTVSAFILPAIASLLGAVVFILRDAERRMESVSLSPMRSETYWPRIILAVIAGTVIGWLSGQDTSGVFGKISPAAASFVVGYSTEILFRLLDSVKQALGVNESDPVGRDRVIR